MLFSQSLQAIALDRCGQRAQALELALEVADTKPTDEAVLNTLSHLYRAMDLRMF